MSAPDIPTTYTITTKGDPNKPISVDMTTGGGERPLEIKSDSKMSMTLDPMQVVTTMQGDPDKPMVTNANVTMDIKNIPHLTLANLHELIRELKKPNLRATMPVEMSFGISAFPFSLLGIDVLRFSICGQQQIIMDEYRPNLYEACRSDRLPCNEE